MKKKLMVSILAVLMTVGVIGTAGAADFTWTLSNASTLRFFASPVTESGVSVYLLAGGSLPILSTTNSSGATLMMVNPTTGASAFWGGAALRPTGTSAFSTPAVISGETVFAQVYNLVGGSNSLSGTSLVAIDGITGTTYYTVSIPQVLGGTGGGPLGGNTFYTAPLLIKPDSTTIYGTSGVSAPGTGASIWALTVSTGSLSSFSTGVSSIWAAPLLSGSSLYVLGDYNDLGAAGGTSIFAFNSASPFALAARANVLGTTAQRPFASPAIAGNSIFVVDATGGLTAYNKSTLAVGTQDFIQFAVQANSQVTASPVTNGAFLAVANNDTGNNTAGVTVFDLSRPLAGSTGASWWFSYSGSTIVATPAISNGVLYLAVNSGGDGIIDRFNLSGHSGKIVAPDFTRISLDSRGRNLGSIDFSSPIIKGNRLIVVSNGGTGAAGAAAANTPVLYNFDVSGSSARGTAVWSQFKANAVRTGENTAAAAAVTVDDDDSGCFISTIK